MKHRNTPVVIRSEVRTSPDGLVVTRWNYVKRGLYASWEMDEVLSMRKPKPVAKEEKIKRGRPVETVEKVSNINTKAKAKAAAKRLEELAGSLKVPSQQTAPKIVLENGVRKVQKIALLPNPECQLNRKAAKRLARRKKDWAAIYSGTKTPPMGAYHCPGSLQ